MSIYNVIPTFWDEALESWIWINDNNENGLVIIENIKNGKRIKTYKRTIDHNVINRINKRFDSTCQISKEDSISLLIINEYYRKKLDINIGCDNNLEIKKANSVVSLFYIPWNSPNPFVQYANRSSLIAIILSFVALILTLITLFQK